MLQVPAAANVANRSGHWAKVCRVPLPATSNRSGVYYSSSATVVRPGAGDPCRCKFQVIRGDNVLFAQLSEVKEASELEESSGATSIISQG